MLCYLALGGWIHATVARCRTLYISELNPPTRLKCQLTLSQILPNLALPCLLNYSIYFVWLSILRNVRRTLTRI